MKEDIDCGIVELKCSICEKLFPRAKDLAYHEKKCEKCVCNICKKEYSNKLSLRRHMVIHDKKYECQVCKKSFAGQGSLNRHAKVHSVSKEKDHACPHCSATFGIRSNMVRHLKKCTRYPRV